MIMGKHAIETVLKESPERIVTIYSHKEDYPFPVKVLSKKSLSELVESDSHQGLVAKVRERNFLNPNEFLEEGRSRSLVLMVDSIQDPQNFGAILRAAECFGVDAVLYSKNRNVGLTPAVSKASVGASEIVPLMPISNLYDTMRKFQERGYFSIAAEARENSLPLNSFEYPSCTLLIVGAEGNGIQPLLSKHADVHLAIPMRGSIDSLNVSQATALFLSHFKWSD